MPEHDDESVALAVPSTSAADEYEKQYMTGHGRVLHRAKLPAPRWMQLLTGGSAIAGIGLLFTPAWMAAMVLIPLGIVSWALFSVLRCTVSEGAVKVQLGLFGPTIPTRAILSAEAIDYDWKKFGGWGIRRASDGEWIYNMPGDGGRAIRIVWTDEAGKRRVTNVGMKAPEAAAAAIDQARRALPIAGEIGALPSGDHGDDTAS
jgi:hypothetical protein